MPLGKSRLDLKVEWRGGDELEKGKMTTVDTAHSMNVVEALIVTSFVKGGDR